MVMRMQVFVAVVISLTTVLAFRKEASDRQMNHRLVQRGRCKTHDLTVGEAEVTIDGGENGAIDADSLLDMSSGVLMLSKNEDSDQYICIKFDTDVKVKSIEFKSIMADSYKVKRNGKNWGTISADSSRVNEWQVLSLNKKPTAGTQSLTIYPNSATNEAGVKKMRIVLCR